jgi:NAD(P)-dependent dehydrogenase (short-subunit alcohol dehydrogenase family)
MEVGRSALVTGAACGIGRAIAERLVADGLGVFVADLSSSMQTQLQCRHNASIPGEG